MLASPLFPGSSLTAQHNGDESAQYRPSKDLEAFNSLLPPPIEFVEGSSSGALAVAEGKYEPINATPRPLKANASIPQAARPPPVSPVKVSRSAAALNGSATGIEALYSGVIDSSWPPKYSVGAGLYNTGNTCFLNSALQCLLHIPPLLRVLGAHGDTDPCRVKGGFCMACSLRDVMFASHIKGRTFTPYPITNKLQLIAKHLRKGRQEDSHEFLRYAIDALQKSCLAGLSPKIDPKVAETTWVHRIFGGRLRSRVTCQECGHNSDTFDSILDLSLDILGVNGLKEALRKFIAVDYLKGADKYKCEKCKKPVVAEKRFTIHEAPHVLTVHLKRFSPLGRKIGHHIKYDERLSLQPAMSAGAHGPLYALCGVICHAGGGPNSGHYLAHVRGADGRWCEMNDDLVGPARAAPPVGLKSAYILFYMRERGQALEAVVKAPPPPPPPARAPGAGLAAAMKKRKIAETDEEDVGVRAKRPFIGPLLPSPTALTPTSSSKAAKAETSPVTSSPPDPQADLIRRKIQAAETKTPPYTPQNAAPASPPSKARAASTEKKIRLGETKSLNALRSLSQYKDDDEDDDDEGDAVGAAPSSEAPKDPEPAKEPASCPPSTPQQPSSPAFTTPPSKAVAAGAFYGPSVSREPNPRKRKSPSDERDDDDDDDDDGDDYASKKDYARTPLLLSGPSRVNGHRGGAPQAQRKPSFGGTGAGNPFARIKGSMSAAGRSDFMSKSSSPLHMRKYGSNRKKRIII